MDLDQLRYFLRVAQRGSFTKAAEELEVSQSALSRSIQRLEDELGQPVFERQTRNLVLTEAGSLLQSRAQQVFSILEDTKAEITDDGQTGRIRIGAIPTIAPYLLPKVLQQFCKTISSSFANCSREHNDKLLHACTQGEVDLAILAMPFPLSTWRSRSCLRRELLLVLPPDHPLVDQEKIKIGDIESYPFVLLDEAHCLSDNIVSFCRQKSFHQLQSNALANWPWFKNWFLFRTAFR